MQILTVLTVFGSMSLLLYGVKCQLDVEELLQAQQRLNGRGGESGSGMGRMIGNSIRSSFVTDALTRAVKFIVGHTAVPSPEMIQHGLAMRSAPRTQAERDIYLALMKTVARRTPDLLMKYMKTEVQKNGTKTYSVDMFALDADITRRALLYQDMRATRRRERQRQREQDLQHRVEIANLNMLQDIRMGRTFGSGVTADAYMFDSFGQTTPVIDINTLGTFGSQTTTPAVVEGNNGATGQQIKPVVDATNNVGTGTVSLLDLLKANQSSG